jgi:hypothetical protein
MVHRWYCLNTITLSYKLLVWLDIYTIQMRVLARVLESEEVVRKKCLKHGIKVTTTQTPFAVHSFRIYVPLWEWSKLIKFGWSTLPLFLEEWLECKMRPILYRMRPNCQISISSFQNFGFAIWFCCQFYRNSKVYWLTRNLFEVLHDVNHFCGRICYRRA